MVLSSAIATESILPMVLSFLSIRDLRARAIGLDITLVTNAANEKLIYYAPSSSSKQWTRHSTDLPLNSFSYLHNTILPE